MMVPDGTGMLRWALLVLGCAPLVYYLVALWAARGFFRRGTAAPPASSVALPPLSILKPVRGLDPGAYENFSSFCRQEFPEYEILFCVSDAHDPVVPVIEKLIRDFPARSIRLFIGAPALGPHNKVNKLALLVHEARHELLLTSDSDVRIPADFLRNLVADFTARGAGAATCLYRSISERSFATDLEILGVTTDFLPGVLVAWRFGGMKFTLGHTVLIERSKLREIGGFEALADCYAEDYELGARLAACGHRILLNREVPEIVFPAISLRGFFRRQGRQMVAIRSSRPWGYAGMIFTQGLPLCLAAAAAAPGVAAAIAFPAAYLLLRLALAWTVGAHGLQDPVAARRWWLVPLYDALAFFVWLAGFFTRRVEWRGTTYEVRRGRMVRTSPAAAAEHARTPGARG